MVNAAALDRLQIRLGAIRGLAAPVRREGLIESRQGLDLLVPSVQIWIACIKLGKTQAGALPLAQ